MELLKVMNWVVTNGPVVLSAVIAVLTSLIGLFMLIPGEQPEKALQSAVDFISRFSRK